MNMSWCLGQIHKGIGFDLGCLDIEQKVRGIPGGCGTHEQMKWGISRFRDTSLVKGEWPLTSGRRMHCPRKMGWLWKVLQIAFVPLDKVSHCSIFVSWIPIGGS